MQRNYDFQIKGSDVSIGTQLEEERMQGDQIIETTD